MKAIMKTVYEIYNDEDKSYIEVGPDSDELGCVEIRYFDEYEKMQQSFVLAPKLAKLVGEAILLSVKDLCPEEE